MSIKRFWTWRYVVPAAVILAPIAAFLFAYVTGTIVMLLWNWLLPTLVGWREITVWQGFGLLVLCRLLFGGFGGGGHRPPRREMTPEDRERFRQRMRQRFGCQSAGDQPE